MAEICPTVTATDVHDYRAQVELISQFAERIHIDLMDGDFAPTRSPDISQLWLPHGKTVDIHAMYRRPMDYLSEFIKIRPSMVIIHAEADVHHMHFAAELHKEGIKSGLCVLADTPMENVEQIISSFDHLLIFSGNLGYHGGSADLMLLEKSKKTRQVHPEIEIGWDGGINDSNVRALVGAGIEVLNVGGSIHRADKPSEEFDKLRQLANK